MVYNENQEKVINAGVDFIKRGHDQIFQISGFPGTGKTEVIKEIVRRANIPLERVAPMAYVGQAASVMRLRGLTNAKTCHSWLYELKEVELIDENGRPVMDTTFNKPKLVLRFVPKPIENIDLIIIDEAYTVPYRMKYEIEKRGIPIIAVGDVNQLPPIKDKPAYLIDGEIHYLTQIMRQKEGSGIVYLSKRILNGEPISAGLYGEVLVIEQKDLTENMLLMPRMILCGTNRTRDKLNTHIRHNLLGIQSSVPLNGEKIICRKNNWNIEVDGISLTNGLIGTVQNYISVQDYNGDTFKISFKPDIINIQYTDISCNYEYFNGNHEQKLRLKANPYLQGELFEPAYAITTHLSQGGQYWNGIYIKEFLHPNIQKNLDYTALTRFINQAIYVIPNKKTFW